MRQAARAAAPEVLLQCNVTGVARSTGRALARATARDDGRYLWAVCFAGPWLKLS